MAEQIPSRLDVLNAGLPTLQMNQISVSPFSPTNDALAGTQDNGTIAYSGSRIWYLPLTGDGGDNGIDAVDPNIHFHMYTGGQIDMNFHGNDPTSWHWVGDAMGIFNTESFRFYAPTIADPVVTKTIFIGGQHVWRTTDLGGNRTFLEQHCNTARACSARAISSSPATAATGRSAARRYGDDSAARGPAVRRRRSPWQGPRIRLGLTAGRVFVSQNADNAEPGRGLHPDRHRRAADARAERDLGRPDQPEPRDHRVSGYNAYARRRHPRAHLRRGLQPAHGTATWTNTRTTSATSRSSTSSSTRPTGDVYVSTDFTCAEAWRAVTTTWVPAAVGRCRR